MFLNLLVKPIWVLVENMVQNDIGHDAYGTYASLFSFVLVFSVLADWGINNYSAKEIAQDNTKYALIFNSFFVVRLVILVGYPLLMVGIGYLAGFDENELYLLVIIALTQTFIYFLMFFRAKFQAFQAFKTDGFMSVIERVVLIILVVMLLKSGITLQTFVAARLIAIVIAVLISFSMVVKLYGWVKLKLSLPDVKNSLKSAFPFTLMTLLFSFNERIDMVMIERLYSNHEAGLYAAAYRWYDALMMFVWLITPMFFSKFAKAKGEKSGASTLFNQGFLLVSIPMLAITPFLFFDGKLLFFLFNKSSELELFRMNRLFQLLIISFIFNAFFVVKGTFLTASGYVKKVNLILLISVLLNVVLNWIFIPERGAYAAGVTTAISTGVLGIGYLVLVMFSSLRIDLKNMLGVLLAFIVSFFLYYYSTVSGLPILFSFMASLLGFYLVLHLFGVIQKIKNFG